MNEDIDIKKLQEENERLNKLYAAKADIVSIDAHQIRTSLSALKWIIKMFLDGDLGKLTTEQENLMKKAYEGNERAISIVSELLLINRNENIMEKEYSFKEIDLTELVDNCIFDFSGEARSRGIELIFLTPDKKLPNVRADKEKLRVVLENLIENGIKYSDKHGKIFISIKQNNEMIEVSIKDTGIGISEEGNGKIFEKFYRDDEAKKRESVGSGIGLFTTKKIVEEHGGKIYFESKKDEGTTFFFTIPVFK
ncbi:MAG: HAMP domain-containing sensor histidine kinase [Candidatus Paceibacterota bacterium]